MSAGRTFRRALLLVAAVVTGAWGLGCAGPEEGQVTVNCPPADEASFKLVSDVLENRCGTLDCHGSMYRPLRIFGYRGLRLPVAEEDWDPSDGLFSDYYTGGMATTEAEHQANASSICGLEPEQIVTFRDASVKDKDLGKLGLELTIIRKAQLWERHKGGRIWNAGDPGEQCLLNWLALKTGEIPNTVSCLNAL